jgi:heme exporter protein D
MNSSLFNSAADFAANGDDLIFNIAAFGISVLAAVGAVAILVWINRR